MKKKKVKYFPNDSYTGVFIRPRTVTKLRTLGQLRHRSVAKSNRVRSFLCSHCTLAFIIFCQISSSLKNLDYYIVGI